ncbi:MAG TPA: MbtH domain protein [Candidatus Angelobacter sp.]|jgi:hypothetical protein|nr:MbtH domain protein [Candidatus Angelobacter sp.]
MSELVRKLSIGSHPVEVSLRPQKSIESLKQCVDRNYVLIKFTNTKGGTELGVPLDPAVSDLSSADFSNGSGHAKFAGNLTLDYVKVRCVADIDLQTFTGQGHLEILQDAQSAS